MKIRCKNCYRVLNNDEEWCTRCGAHSDEVAEYLRTGTVPVDEAEISKRSFIFYFFFAFILNGVLDIIFGMIYNAANETYLGEVGQSLPYAITYFSSINALTITSILTFTLILAVNLRDIKNYIHFKFDKRTILSLSIGTIIVIGLCFLFKYTPFTIVPEYFKQFLISPTADMLMDGSVNLFKIIIVMFFFGLTEELIFRKAFINYLDQSTLMNDASIIILSTLVSTGMMITCYLLLVKATFLNYLFFIITNLVVNGLLAFNYFINHRSLIVNVILRILFILFFVIILLI